MSIPKNAVYVDTTKYVASHGTLPRGRGGWAFCDANRWMDVDYLDHLVMFGGLFRAAKAKAVEHFASDGVDHIVVCP